MSSFPTTGKAQVAAALAGIAATAAAGLGIAWQAGASPDDVAAAAAPMIIDGGQADSAPWAARVYGDGMERCSGTIIAPTWVLTAAHCAQNINRLTFRIGQVDQAQGVEAAATPDGVRVNEAADIMLVQLDRPVETTYAPLAAPGAVPVGQTGRIYGWGATCLDRPADQCQSPTLKVATVNITGTGCTDHLQGPAICTTRGDGIAANGDSGGPLFVPGPGGDVQAGLLSHSDDTANASYVDVTAHRDWISSVAGV